MQHWGSIVSLFFMGEKMEKKTSLLIASKISQVKKKIMSKSSMQKQILSSTKVKELIQEVETKNQQEKDLMKDIVNQIK